MFIKPSKKWRNPEGDQTIMVPYTYYRLCESYREADGKVKQRTVLGLGELLEFPTESEKRELANLLTSLINEGIGKLSDNPRLYDAALGVTGNEPCSVFGKQKCSKIGNNRTAFSATTVQ